MVDPLANKYYQLSPYSYCANNPIKYVDPDGRYIVGRNGNEVKFKINETKGTIRVRNATSDTRRLARSVQKAGTGAGFAAFKTIATNQTRTHIKYINDNKVFKTGYHQAHDKNGNALEWNGNSKTGKFEGKAEFISDNKGNIAYKESTITLNKSWLNNDNILKARGDDKEIKSLTMDEAVVGTLIEEVDHSTNPNTVQAVKDRQEGIQNRYDIEAAADIPQKAHYDELKKERDEEE